MAHLKSEIGKKKEKKQKLLYQVRINLAAEFADVARSNPGDKRLAPLNRILDKYQATIKNQYDAFADFIPPFKAHEFPTLVNEVEYTLEDMWQAEADGDTQQGIEALHAFEQAATELAARTRLYLWTMRDIIEKPEKKEAYSKRFTIYADGNQEVYSKKTANGLEKDLKALQESGMIEKIQVFSSDPEKNPQPNF
jgi:hypothetical protein